jgi:hypothetical protein
MTAALAVLTDCNACVAHHVPFVSAAPNPALPFANPVSKPNDNPDEKFMGQFGF